MGAGQFLRDYRRDYHIQKSMAHRKAVLQRKAKAKEKKMKVNLKQIGQDRSVRKRCSHIRLLALVNELGAMGLKRLYRKKELSILCEAYGVNSLSSWNKSTLSTALSAKIAQCEFMPRHQVTSLYTVDVQEEHNSNNIPVLKLQRI